MEKRDIRRPASVRLRIRRSGSLGRDGRRHGAPGLYFCRMGGGNVGGRRFRERLSGLVFWLGLAASAAVYLHPVREDALARLRQAAAIGMYRDYLGGETPGMLEQQYRDAEAYNRLIFQRQKEEGFRYLGENASDEVYESLPAGENEIMGYLEIPSINVFLPIAHGTKAEVLSNMAGHVYGTSLPVGGADTHAVIAGHTGVPSAELFDGLLNLEKGDSFVVRILGRELHYRVESIRKVLPEEADRYLGIREGKDCVTLFTCTPPGINDHRLLLTGERVEATEGHEDDGPGSSRREREAWLKLFCSSAVPPLLGAAGAVGFFRRRGRFQ